MDMMKGIEKAAHTIRLLTIDAVQKAASGHPGLPMGLAELGALLYGEVLKHNPADPEWIDRDRFILSAGHGSLLLYCLLYFCGYGLTLDDIKNFRQLGSKTAGHPERGRTPGIETTTGPLGQGIGNAVGMAIAEWMLAQKFNTPEQAIIDHYTYVIASDGCMMEGVSSEACSLAGHLGLGKLIVFYDSNKITIDGSTALAFTEKVLQRFEAYGWQTFTASAYDIPAILSHIAEAKKETKRPTIILLESIIGKGSPNKQGTQHSHGAPLGEDEVKATKRALGIPETEMFHVDEEAFTYFNEKKQSWSKACDEWKKNFEAWKKKNPELYETWKLYFGTPGFDIEKAPLPEYKLGDKVATRDSQGAILNATAQAIPNFIGGSADLASSNKTYLKNLKDFQKQSPEGRNLNFGVREHAMGAITNGLALHGGLRPFCATFFVFADYMRPPIRLAAIMRLPVIYVFTHDSIYVGEDGPTHQPVEQFASLRAIPRLEVWRPGDAQENVEVWKLMYKRTDGPSLIGLTRQGLTVYGKDDANWKKQIAKGAYIVKDSSGIPALVIIATGSEVETALAVHQVLGRKDVRVVSMPCRERFLALKATERETLIPRAAKRVIIEAGVAMGWEGLAGDDGLLICMHGFGESGNLKAVGEHFGFQAKKIAEQIAGAL
jgi:transketolase